MTVSFLHKASVAVPALLMAMSVGATDNDRSAGPSIRTIGGQVQITKAIKVGSLDSLRNVPVNPADFHKGQRVHALDRIPRPGHNGASTNVLSGDRVVQTRAIAVAALAVTNGSNVFGQGSGFVGPAGTYAVGSAPPDTVGAIGATQFMQVVNTTIAVWDKATKVPVLGAIPTNSLWHGFGGQCESTNDGDGTVVYDKAAQRWVVSQFALQTAPYAQCVAVSKTADATGGWWLYQFNVPSTDLNDYPKMGVWPDGYYETFNMFGSSFDGALACAYDRSKMLTGAPATQQCFQLSPDFGGVLPSDLDGHTAPTAGTPNYLLNFGTDSLNLWKFHVDWANPANSTLSSPTVIAVASFIGACNYGGSCVKQLNAPINRLDSLGDRMMYRLAYRKFGDHESLVATHSVDIAGTQRTGVTGIRWYEIRSPGSTPVVYQQSTFSPDATYRWMPSIAMDKQGNIAVGYSVSSVTINPGIRYTGRLASDPLNTLQAETTMVNGGGAQKIGLSRWGDYSAMTVDPADDCTFWYTQEYIASSGTFNWSTRIGSFKFPTCN